MQHPNRTYREAWVPLSEIGPTRKALEDEVEDDLLWAGLILQGRVEIDVRANNKTGKAHILACGLGYPPRMTPDPAASEQKIAAARAKRNKIGTP